MHCPQASPKQDCVERKETATAHEPEFLTNHRKDEVGVLHPEEIQLGLCAVPESTPPPPTRSDTDPRLDQVVPSPKGSRSGDRNEVIRRRMYGFMTCHTTGKPSNGTLASPPRMA